MTGAIAGDIIGSVYEYESTKQYDFQLFHQNSTNLQLYYKIVLKKTLSL